MWWLARLAFFASYLEDIVIFCHVDSADDRENTAGQLREGNLAQNAAPSHGDMPGYDMPEWLRLQGVGSVSHVRSLSGAV